MDDSASDVRPQKRVKLGSAEVDAPGDVRAILATHASDQNGPQSTIVGNDLVGDETKKEVEVGITTFVDASRNIFQGTLKKRYTDFLVNEILLDGTVLHLQKMDAKSTNFRTVREDGAGIDAVKLQDQEEANAPTNGSDAPQDTEIKAKDTTAETRLESAEVPNSEVADSDRVQLTEHFGESVVNQMIALYESVVRHPGKKSRDHPMVRTPFTSDRGLRSQIHQNIRRIFQSKIESSTDKDGVLVLTAAASKSRSRGWTKPNESARPGKLSWIDRGGEYTHFTLYKENKDTLEVISFLSKQLKTNNKLFQFAGTKDRRAVTVQRASAYRIEAERLAGLNRILRNSALGDFQYQKKGLELGDLSGNEFLITLRDCNLEKSGLTGANRRSAVHSHLTTSLQDLREKGFLNYYGLQRFGTYATRTDFVGLNILQGNFRGACDAILDFSPAALTETSDGAGSLVSQDDRARAEGINIWRTTGRINDALDKLPRKFSAESAVIRHLGKQTQDFVGALLSIQRNLRLMYVHAYQSLVWNLAVGERWRLFGDKVVEGDLVLVHEHREKERGTDQPHHEGGDQNVDADGEIIVQPSGDDRAYDPDDRFERARALTADEAASGAYSIFDLVLPLPGFDVVYPTNASGEWYKSFMASEAGGKLDPHNMRRRQKDFSLSGSYRKVVARIGANFEVNVHEYSAADGDRQFVETDMERIKRETGGGGGSTASANFLPPQAELAQDLEGGSNPESKDATIDAPSRSGSEPTKIAAVLKFQLGSSQYATMALRELSKGGIQAYKAEFVGGR